MTGQAVRRSSSAALLSVVVFLLASPLAAAGPEWLQFRGTSDKSGVSFDTSPDRALGWTYEVAVQSQFVASPVSDGVQLVVADYSGVVSALNVLDGSLRWTRATQDIITATPAIFGNLVLVPSGKRMVALEVLPGGTSVAERWVFNTSARIDSSPTVSAGAVYFGGDDRQVYKLDARNGTLWWNFTTSDVVKGSPAVVGGRVFVGSYDGHLYALNDDGANVSVAWTFDVQGEVAASAAVSGGSVFVPTLRGRVFALDALSGAKLWEASPGGVIVASPAVEGDHVYVGGGTLAALDATNGVLLWDRPLTGYVRASPAIHDSLIFCADYGGRVFVFRENGSLAWSTDTGSAVRSSPTVGNGFVFVGNDAGRIFGVPLDAGQFPQVQTLAARETFEGVTETFSAVASDPENRDLSFLWDFGDGGKASGRQVTHHYGSAGNYTVNLTVSDGQNFESVSSLVTVLPFTSTVGGGQTTAPRPGGTSTLLIGGVVLAVIVAAILLYLFVFSGRKAPVVEPSPPAPELYVPPKAGTPPPAAPAPRAPPRAPAQPPPRPPAPSPAKSAAPPPRPPAAPAPTAPPQGAGFDYYRQLGSAAPPPPPQKGPKKGPRPPEGGA